MAERRKRNPESEDEFYEAMPGTFDQSKAPDRGYFDDDDWASDDYGRNSVLPWVLVAALVALLGLLVVGGLSLNG